MINQSQTTISSPETLQAIKQQIDESPIILFMKGNANFPQCGFSATVVKILKSLNLPFKDVDVLIDNDIRQGIKDFSQWPTIPQLYIKGEFIGGCDIVREMFQTGELQDYLINKGFEVA